MKTGEYVNASTALATIDNEEICEGTHGGQLSAPGLFYLVVGTGRTIGVTISQADFEVQISVYNGNCSALSCVAGSGGDPTSNFMSANLAFESEFEEVYYIKIFGFSGAVGEFELQIEDVSRPENDDCSTATEVSVGEHVIGSTLYASSMKEGWEFCGSSNQNSAPGLFYFLVGKENEVVTVDFEADYDIQVTVYQYSGNDCSSLSCIVGSDGDESSEYKSGSVTWNVEPGKRYAILVHGYNTDVGKYLRQQSKIYTVPNCLFDLTF